MRYLFTHGAQSPLPARIFRLKPGYPGALTAVEALALHSHVASHAGLAGACISALGALGLALHTWGRGCMQWEQGSRPLISREMVKQAL